MEKMSKQTDSLDVEKCIVSRLWYTAVTIIHDRTNTTDIENLSDLIKSCADQGLREHRWIGYNLLFKLDNNEETKKILAREEFDSTMRLLDIRIPHGAKEELLKLFESVRSAENKNDVSAWQLSPETLECLKTNLLKSPAVVHRIIDGLLCIWLPTRFAQSDSALQDIYFHSIRKLFRFDDDEAEDEKKLSVGSTKNVKNFDRQRSGVLLSILSKINLTETKEDELIAWLYPVLHDFCNWDHVELALYSRKKFKFFNTWHNYLDEKYARCDHVDNSNSALKIIKIIFNENEDSTTSLHSEEMFKRTLRMQSHWLMDIINICHVLLTNENRTEVEKIFKNPILKDFWLILLVKLLKDCPTEPIYSPETHRRSSAICSALSFVLEKFEQTNCNDPTLSSLKTILNNHLNVLNWILNSEKSSSSTIAATKISPTYPSFSVRQILHLLQNHSVLDVLKITTDVHRNDCKDVSRLLIHSKDCDSTFRAYRAMLSALEAMLLGETKNLDRSNAVENFDDMEKSLGNLFPMDLRLEVIENIFTMIFIRHEDFVEPDSASDGEDKNFHESTKNDKASKKSDSGFLCDEWTTREILHRLRRSVTAVKLELEDEKKIPELGNNFENRLTVISKSLTDATWRLELLTSNNSIDKRDDSNSKLVTDVIDDSTITHDDRLNCSNVKTIFYKPEESSSDDGEFAKSDLDGNCDNGSQINSTGMGCRRRKKLRKHSSINEPTMVTRDLRKRERTLNRMLASKESLVLQCLWRGDYDRALQVTEMFGLKNDHLEGEILFSRAMRSLRKDLRTQWIDNDAVDSLDLDSKQSTLDNIRRVVQDGFHTSRLTNQVETFLASQESSVRRFATDSKTSKEILTMASLDLALTMSRTHRHSLNLTSVTTKYLRSCEKFSNPRCHEFFEIVQRLLYENTSQSSIPEILCDGKIPLSSKKFKEKIDYWSRLTERLENRKKIYTQKDKDLLTNEIFVNLEKNNFDDISMICENGEIYLPRINGHLELLRTIVNDENVVTNFCILKISLDDYIGDQLFRLNFNLEQVENVATKLRVNLVHSILVNCCPKMFLRSQSLRKNSKKWGSTVLNETTDTTLEFNNYEPNQCVTEILSELLTALGSSTIARSTLRPSDLKEISKNHQVKKILSKTQRLAKLDLSNLSFGDHTLTFFVNVWNLMILHAMIVVWSFDPPTNDLRHEISLTTICYEIGDLGTVSLRSLRTKLIGQTSWGPRFFDNTEELNEPAWQDLDVPNDPRVIFAIVNEFNDSPIIRIYNPQTLNDDLNEAVVDYLKNCNDSPDVNNILWLPELINRHNDFITKKLFAKNSYDVETSKSASKICYEPLIYTYNVRLSYDDEKLHTMKILKTSESTKFSWNTKILKTNLLQYLEGHCWLLSYLVQRIHEESPTIIDSNCENTNRTESLENLLKSNWTYNLKSINEDNQTVAGLRDEKITNEYWNNFENLLTSNDVQKCLNVVNGISECSLTNDSEIQRLNDVVLANLATDSQNFHTNEIIRYVYQIRDENVLARLILSNFNDWPIEVCREIISHVQTHVNVEKLPRHCKSKINEISCRVEIFKKMLPHCPETENNEKRWRDLIELTETTDQIKIIRSLMDANKFELCLEWLDYQSISSEINFTMIQDLLMGLLNNDDGDFKNVVKLLKSLPLKKSINLCQGVMNKLETVEAMRFVVGWLSDNCEKSNSQRHRRGLLGIYIIERLEEKERRSYFHLVEEPIFMLEQLLMNCRLDGLGKIVVGMREIVGNDYCSKRFDEIVRFYAAKSLDFRVAVQTDVDRIKDVSVSIGKSQNGDFVMPAKIPTKDEWVPNDKARECSCCGVVIFTMFNRRHHCRRCGRVVCATCSPQRMRLPNYPSSVAVRVCNDCKRQIYLQSQAPSTPSSEVLECWRLTVDENHNKTLRDEFSFENAPNISLCLAILNLHSDHEAYSNFLLDRCDEMKELLRPDSKGRLNPEIDHGLIIKMIRSLLIAAKVKYSELGLNTGLIHCDGFLSQVDLISTLINSDCSSLIPKPVKDDHLDDNALPRLRDLLTEKEQWTLALDVSTKAGLDTQGVWAAWGTACLKAGYYDRAREKFARCLDKVIREDSDDWVMLSHPNDSIDETKKSKETKIQKISSNRRKFENPKFNESTKNRPNRDAPLLTEILQILEKINPNDWYCQKNSKIRTNCAQEILNTLNSLKSMSLGHLQNSTLINDNFAKNFRYQESLYYLIMYGSYNSILNFFVKHEDYDKCLDYILENDVEPELFVDVFLRCLKNDCSKTILEAMRTKDSSLVTFKKYLLHACHSLERKKFFNTLHELQIFMKDYVRAAMTCIRFYVNEATSYVDLVSRTHFLIEAQKHLESELQMEHFLRKKRRSSNSSNVGQQSLTLEMDTTEIDRHMNTISRQMEIAKFLGNRENEGQSVGNFMNRLSYMDDEGSTSRTMPTLFGNQQEKTHLAVLAILCGRDVEEGFGIAFRIMQDYNLRQQKIYSLVGHMLALERKTNSIEQLIKCCRSSGAPNSNAISDRVLAHCVKLLLDRSRTDSDPSPKDQIDSLIRIITDVELKIDSYIESRQLKAAYLLAVKHSRAQDIRKILKEADRLGQVAIKSICTKWLQQTQGV